MNTKNILDLINIADGLSKTAPATRRETFRNVAMQGGAFVAAAATALVGAGCVAVGKVVAPDTDLAKATLRFAILLEELEHEFYVQALDAKGLIPDAERPIFEAISKHEGSHVLFLNTGLTGIGGTAETAPTFDFTARGRFPGVFRNYRTFLTVAQALEDTGVRAYKGQAGNLITSSKLLTAALRIHSVEARHAAVIRRLRGVKGWITGSESNGAPGAVYAGEGLTTQAGVDVAAAAHVSQAAASEAFDEPLTKQQVMAIVSPFIRG